MVKQITLKEIGEMIAHIVKHMVTKDDLKHELAPIKKTLAEHTKTLAEHSRDLEVIKGDVKTNLDKRLQLEMRVATIERTVGISR